MYGPFPRPLARDSLTQSHDKFFIPHTMTKRAEEYFRKRKVQNRTLRRARLLHMKTPLPPASDCSSDDSVENVKSLTLIKTPYFVIPTFRYVPRKKKERLRNRFMSQNQLRRIRMLLYDRSRMQVPKVAEVEVKTPLEDAAVGAGGAIGGKHIEKFKSLRVPDTSRRARYRNFIRECYWEKLKEFEETYGKPKDTISFENFKQSTRVASMTSSLQNRDADAPSAEAAGPADKKKKKPRVRYHIPQPPPVFNRKRHLRTTCNESSFGPLYLDPHFMEKFRKPRSFTRFHNFYTSTLRDRPEARDRLYVTSRAFEEEKFGFDRKYLHRLATEWDENFITDLQQRPPARKFCVKSDILELRNATRKIFSMYYTTENMLNLLEQQKAEEAAIEEVENFSNVCSDFLTNIKNDSYDRVIRKAQALKPLQEKTNVLKLQVEELKAELEFITESVLEEERKWDTLMKLQNYYYLLMEPEWRKVNDWIHRTASGELHEAVDIIEMCSVINVRKKTSPGSIREYFECEIFPNIERMKGIQPEPQLLRNGLQTLKQKVFTSLNQYNKTMWMYEIFLRQVNGLRGAFVRSETQQRKMMKFQGAKENFLAERAYILSYEVKQVMGKPLERSVKSPTATRIKIKAICNQLYDFIVPHGRRCPQIDDQMTPSEKFAKLHDYVMELLHQLDRIPIAILHKTEKDIRREQMCLHREAQKAVVKQNRFELLQKQIRGHFESSQK
ncbi:uncharacterized protein LOC129794691 [Lutzomyia longipalpis]|uniref:uncharacterized protein LOC129794691 n=1 Tax=Lutzomyia longipalpis TaxID=7200 RepID=UPI00248372BD|nr:uncharacterized protein LOC129794691 [Lutzomyia longipalpis]